MDSQEQQLIDRIKQAQNVLVTVSTNPSVDQLAAAIGLTIALNKLDKHGTAVFSGQIPSTIEFLKPEETLEKTTDSLRDFIIALDKNKADKLRYKVEDEVVRIFITPYRTSLSERDLQFSQGDFNVDVVIALGVADQQDIDAAITAHGRILHDATVASVSVGGSKGDLGTINWVDEHTSSLSEMMLGLIDGLGKDLLDNQIATALLTGIVATTDRFRNEHTTPKAMNASAELMAAGANQQLIASELAAPVQPVVPLQVHTDQTDQDQGDVVPGTEESEPGTLDIDHQKDDEEARPAPEDYRAPMAEPDLGNEAVEEAEPQQPEIHVDEDGQLSPVPMPVLSQPLPPISQVHVVEPDEAESSRATRPERMTTPPVMGGPLTAAATDDDDEPATEALTLPSLPAATPLLNHNESVLPPVASLVGPVDNGPFIPQMPLPAAPPALPLPPSPQRMPFLSAPPSSSMQLPAMQQAQPYYPPLSAPLPQPLPPAPTVPLMPLQPPVSPASAGLRPGETLEELERAVHSPHLAQPVPNSYNQAAGGPAGVVDSARDAVRAAFNSGSPADEPPREPITALNALPLGPDLHSMPAPPPSAAGTGQPIFGTPPPGPALDMPSPSNPFGPGQQNSPAGGTPAGILPSMPPPPGSGGAPLVPPPFVPPMPQ